MNLYEISATLENGAVHKTKIYEINQERALNRASKFALQFDPTGCAKKTVQLIQKNAGVPKETERAFLNEIKEILEGLGENSYCAMAFEGCVEDAEENIDNDFAVSMKGRWESEKKAHEETREGLISKLNDRIKRVAELEAEVQKARQMEAQARKEAAEDKIALEKAKGKILPDNVAAELTIILRKQADEAAKEALYYADRMTVEVENSVPDGAANSAKHFREYRKAQVDALRLLGALGNIGGLKDSQTKAVADAAKDSAETSKAAAETSKDLLNKTTAAAQQAAASAASASYALGPDESGRLSFFIKKST